MTQREKAAVGAPTLKPADLPAELANRPAMVLHIATVDERESQFQNERSGKKESKLVLTFTEVPERELWLGKRARNQVIDHLGADDGKWVGQAVPLINAMASVGGKQYRVLQVAEDWDAVLAEVTTSPKRKR